MDIIVYFTIQHVKVFVFASKFLFHCIPRDSVKQRKQRTALYEGKDISGIKNTLITSNFVHVFDNSFVV